MTTAVSFPLTEMDVCPDPEMALNAYSVESVIEILEKFSWRYLPTW
jgi:hypothetical protein